MLLTRIQAVLLTIGCLLGWASVSVCSQVDGEGPVLNPTDMRPAAFFSENAGQLDNRDVRPKRRRYWRPLGTT